MKLKRFLLAAAVIAAVAPLSAYATNGYFSHGYGMKAKGMGGANTAVALDSMSAAANPALMGFVGNELAVGAELFSPRREATRANATSGGFPAANGTATSDSNYFVVPELGFNYQLGSTMTAGLTIYGNGGLNTDYPGNEVPCGPGVTGNLFCGPGELGVNMNQLLIAPSFTYKLTENHSFGISPVLGYMSFAAKGLDQFTAMSADPAHVTNQGTDQTFGYGARIGWAGKVHPMLALGASYSTKIYMKKFEKYAGLFAEQGDFDIPANFSLGAAMFPIEGLTVSFDFERILYGQVKSIANGFAAQPLGSNDGPGFGWQNQNVYKLGIQYRAMNELTLRGGWNYGKMPINKDNVTFNILAPATIEHHLTLGGSYKYGPGELTFAYMHAFEKKLEGATKMPGFDAGTEIEQMYEDSIGLAYEWKI